MTVSKLLFIAMGVVFFSPAMEAQSPAALKDTTSFLWFKGYWKQKTRFITTGFIDSVPAGPGGGGDTLTLRPGGQVHLTSAGIHNWNKKLDAGLNDLENFEEELKAPANSFNEFGHHFSEAAMPWLNDLHEEYSAYKIDPSEDLLESNGDKAEAPASSTTYKDVLNSWCSKRRSEYEALMAFYQAHRKDKYDDLPIPVPPEFDFSCATCDTGLLARYDKMANDFATRFFLPESNYIRSALGMLHDLELLGIATGESRNTNSLDTETQETIYQAFHTNKTNPGLSGACAYMDIGKISEAVYFLMNRLHERAQKLLKVYHDNMKTFRAIVPTVLAVARQVELIGGSSGNDLAELGGYIGSINSYYADKLLHQHDWTQAGNLPFLLGLERQCQLLGNPGGHLADLIAVFDRFRLQVDMEVKLGNKDGYYLSHLKGKAKIAPEYYEKRDKDSCYHWVIVEGLDPMGLPKKKASQQVDCDLLTNEVVAPGPRPQYIGTKNYYALLPLLKMDYCNPGKDSIYLTSFIAKPDASAGKWQYPGAVMALGINKTDAVFRDVPRMEALAASGQLEQQAIKMKERGEQLAAQMKAVAQKMSARHSMGSMEDMHKLQELAAKARSLGNNENTAPVLYIDFPLPIHNGSSTLVEKRFDAKEINPEEAHAIIYGYYTVKVIYEDPPKPGATQGKGRE